MLESSGAAGRVAVFSVALFGAWCLVSDANAQTLTQEMLAQQGLGSEAPAGEWNVTLGGGLAARPDFPGASDHKAAFVPIFLIKYRDDVFLGPAGLGWNVFRYGGLTAGPVLGYEGGRDAGSNSHLAGLGDIDASLTAGGFLVYRIGQYDLTATVRQSITHANNGLTALIEANHRFALVPHRLVLVAGGDVEFANRRYDETWFGVTDQQSAQSGLPAYAAGGGLKDAGIHATLTYACSEHFLLHAFGHVSWLTGDDANSPIVQDKTQFFAGLGVAYRL